MTMPPPDVPEAGLWMHVSDVFHIKGRGTVVTGRLDGAGLLSTGDSLVCDGQRWPVSGIEQFRAILKTAEPGSSIGVLVRGESAVDVLLRGKLVQFVPGAGPAAAGPRKRLRRRRG